MNELFRMTRGSTWRIVESNNSAVWGLPFSKVEWVRDRSGGETGVRCAKSSQPATAR